MNSEVKTVHRRCSSHTGSLHGGVWLESFGRICQFILVLHPTRGTVLLYSTGYSISNVLFCSGYQIFVIFLYQVFSPVSDVLERASLAALTAITGTLSLNVMSDQKTPSLEGFLRDIFKGLEILNIFRPK